MNKFISILLILAAMACKSTTPPIGYKLFGNIKNMPDGQVILKRFIDGTWQSIDTTMMQTGTFTLEGKVDLPEVYRIHFSDTLPEIPVFIDNHEITITASIDSLGSARISGSKVQEEYEAFWGTQQKYESRLDSIYGLYKIAKKKNDRKKLRQLDQSNDATVAEKNKALKTYVVTNKASVVSAYLTWTNLSHETTLKELDSITCAFDSTIHKSVYIALLKDYINVLRKVDIGQPAPDFTMNDPNGNPLKLSSFHPRYLLLDFWASWCSPCRQENPALVAAYKLYHRKGFDILSISFDKNKNAWLSAMKKDKLNWHHASDLQWWDNEAGKLYGIRNIPSNILIDRKGIIIAKNLKGKKLQEKLKELLN